jgi:coniferyl-aldehyde dehydrogenase
MRCALTHAPHDDGTRMNQSDDARALLKTQRAAFRADGIATARVRIDRLDRALDLLVTHQAEICDAVAGDFARRPGTLTRFVDVLPSVMALKHARCHLRRWMRPQQQRVSLPACAQRSCTNPSESSVS